MSEEMLKAAGMSPHAIAKAQALGLPPGTIISIISKFGPIVLQILEELLAGHEQGNPPSA